MQKQGNNRKANEYSLSYGLANMVWLINYELATTNYLSQYRIISYLNLFSTDHGRDRSISSAPSAKTPRVEIGFDKGERW